MPPEGVPGTAPGWREGHVLLYARAAWPLTATAASWLSKVRRSVRAAFSNGKRPHTCSTRPVPQWAESTSTRPAAPARMNAWARPATSTRTRTAWPPPGRQARVYGSTRRMPPNSFEHSWHGRFTHDGPAILLTNDALSTLWAQRLLEAGADVCCLRERVCFIDPVTGQPAGSGPLQGQIVWGLRVEPAAFASAFGPLGPLR